MLAKLRSFWRRLSRRADFEREMAEELQFHVDARAADLIARHGLPAAEAHRRARIEFGAVEKFKEEGRASVGLRLVDELRSDVRYASRTLRADTAFAAAVIATLALGIGANAAVFSVVDAVLVRPLPVRNPHELVVFDWLRTPESMVASYSGYGRPGPVAGTQVRTSFSLLTFERFRDHARSLASVCAYARLGPISVVVGGAAETASGQLATGDYFTTLGVGTAVGRALIAADDRPGSAPVAVISHRYWRRRLDGDPAVVGTTISVNRVPVTIVGVTDEHFFGTHRTESFDVTLPMTLAAAVTRSRAPISSWWVEMIARLKPGITPEQAAAELKPVFEDSVRESWAARSPDVPNPTRTGMPELRLTSGEKGAERTRRDAAPMLAFLFAVGAAILVIGCVNVVNLLLVRTASRGHELSVRLAVGAGRGRIVRQLLTESAVLALLGGAAGLILARWAKDLTAWLIVATPQEVPQVKAAIDARVLGFALLLCFATALACGVGPALRVTRGNPGAPSRPGGHGDSTRRGRARKILVAVQVALSLTLVVAAGLFTRTLQNFAAVDVGFNTGNLLVFRVAGTSLPFYEELAVRLEAIPGVESATFSAMPLIARHHWTDPVQADGRGRTTDAHIQAVRSNFFETIELPLVSGRTFGSADVEDAPRVAIVNQAMAQKLFGSPNPIGRRFHLAEGPDRHRPIEVVGLVRDAKYSNLQAPPPPTVYIPYTQRPPAPMTFEVRTSVEPLSVVPAVKAAARSLDPGLPLMNVQTQEQQIADTIRTERRLAMVTSLFSAIALLLASVGLYGIVAYDVRRRTTEIGVRMALGARRADVLRIVLGETIATVGIGTVAGAALVLAGSHLVERMLFGIRPSDPLTMASAIAGLAIVAAAAAYFPARRAVRIDPTQALRYE